MLNLKRPAEVLSTLKITERKATTTTNASFETEIRIHLRGGRTVRHKFQCAQLQAFERDELQLN